MPIAWITHAACARHEIAPNHPESPRRLAAIEDRLITSGLGDFMQRFEAIEEIERGVAKGDWYGRMYAHNRRVVESYARNPGIMRCMVQVGDEQPEFGELWRSSYHRRLELFVRALPRLFPAAALTGAQAQLVTTLLAGIGEHVLSEYYIVRTPETVKATAAMLEKHPDRFLFGTDEVAPKDQAAYLKVYDMYAPLWQALTPATSEKVRLGNYARLFDEARVKVRAWEQANVR